MNEELANTNATKPDRKPRATFTVPQKAAQYMEDAVDNLRKLATVLKDGQMKDAINALKANAEQFQKPIEDLPDNAFGNHLPRGFGEAIVYKVGDVVTLREKYIDLYSNEFDGVNMTITKLIYEKKDGVFTNKVIRVLCKIEGISIPLGFQVGHVKLV